MFICSYCDAQHPKWSGRCTQCSKWGTLGEGDAPKKASASQASAPAAELVDFGSIESSAARKQKTGISELDRVLGGGIVPGQVVLLSGEPGIGKSTLLTDLTGSYKGLVLYVAGEESPSQLKLRFERLGANMDEVKVTTSTIAESIVSTIQKHKPALVVVDSIQTLTTKEHEAAAGAPTHLRASAALLTEVAKRTNVPVILVGQVTKDGTVAGPKLLEHMVDTVLSFTGDTQHAYRILRASKHRFGSVDEIGIFEMTEKGLKSVTSPGDLFMNEERSVPGSVVTCTVQGARALTVELQALVNASSYGTPVRRGSGFNTNRLQMLLAIIEKHGGVSFAGQDVYVNVVGGMSINEPAADLAICAALISSKQEQPVPVNTVIFGEVGLGGEVRSVPFAEKRIKESGRLGMKQAIHPKSIKNVRELVQFLKRQK